MILRRRCCQRICRGVKDWRLFIVTQILVITPNDNCHVRWVLSFILFLFLLFYSIYLLSIIFYSLGFSPCICLAILCCIYLLLFTWHMYAPFYSISFIITLFIMFHNALGPSNNFPLFLLFYLLWFSLYFVFPRAYRTFEGLRSTRVVRSTMASFDSGNRPCKARRLSIANLRSPVSPREHEIKGKTIVNKIVKNKGKLLEGPGHYGT